MALLWLGVAALRLVLPCLVGLLSGGTAFVVWPGCHTQGEAAVASQVSRLRSCPDPLQMGGGGSFLRLRLPWGVFVPLPGCYTNFEGT